MISRAAVLCALGLMLLASCDGPTGRSQFVNAIYRPQVAFVDAGPFDSERSRIVFSAHLDPGVTSRGKTRKILQTTLRVLGTDVPPSSQHARELYYDQAFPMASTDFADQVVELETPPIEGAAPLFSGLRWFGIGRRGPASIRVSEGEDVPLQLILPNGVATPTPEISVWRLNLGRVRIQLPGMPPEEVVVPAELLSGGAEPMRVDLTYTQAHQDDFREATYVVIASVEVFFSWMVSVAGF